MQKQLTFKKDITRKFMIFAIIPSFLLAISLLYTLSTLKEDSIKETHTKLLENINYSILDFYNQITTTEQVILSSKEKDRTIFQNILQLNNAISSIIIIDYNGKMKKIYENEPNLLYKNFNFNEILNIKSFTVDKKSFFGNLYKLPNSDQSFIPFYFHYNNAIGIINIDGEYFQKYVERLLKNDLSLSIYIVNESGLCIANSFATPTQKEQFSFYTTATSKAILLNDPNKLIKFSDKNKTTRVTYINQKEMMWKIIVKDLNDKVLNYIQNILLFIGSFMILLLIFTIITARRVARNIVEPVESLILEIQDFANEIEHFETTTTIKSKYYIFNVLIESFEKMKDDIIDREIELKNLNDTLEEKTNQLETLNQTLQYRLQSQG